MCIVSQCACHCCSYCVYVVLCIVDVNGSESVSWKSELVLFWVNLEWKFPTLKDQDLAFGSLTSNVLRMFIC